MLSGALYEDGFWMKELESLHELKQWGVVDLYTQPRTNYTALHKFKSVYRQRDASKQI